MRYVKTAWLTACLAVCLFIVSNAEAVPVALPPGQTKTDPPLIVTGYAFQGPKLYYVQLFNGSDEVVDVKDWRLQFTISGREEPVQLAFLDGLIKPGGYIVAGEKASLPTADIRYELVMPEDVTGTVSSIQLLPASHYLAHVVTTKSDPTHLYWRRNVSATSGNYLSSFTAFTPDNQFILYGNGFYDYPTATLLQVAEVLANPRNCSPLEVAGDCSDYVKLHNPSSQPISLSQFRLRVGYRGQSVSTSNTFVLQGDILPGHYSTVTKSPEGHPLSLTNSGGFIWLEDVYGLKIYEPTVVEYPDASADAKKGQAWAYDSKEGIWKWTAQPTPADAPSVFPVLAPPVKKVTASSSLSPCKEGQYRSEETNRCRSLAAAVTALSPCDDDEERNPATNRCRKIASAASKELAPCKTGQERNPETNRCRNVLAASPNDAAFAVDTVQEAGKAFIGWWALGGVGILALGYGIWEWRSEMMAAIQKGMAFFSSHK